MILIWHDDSLWKIVTAQIVEAQQSETEMADSLERALEENEQLRAQLDQLRVEHEQTSGWLQTVPSGLAPDPGWTHRSALVRTP